LSRPDLRGAHLGAPMRDGVAQLRVLPLEITGAIACDARPQCQVLRTSRRPDGIGLHEPQRRDRTPERRRRKQAARHGKPPEGVERGHSCSIVA
jgi:hypothetical protein